MENILKQIDEENFTTEQKSYILNRLEEFLDEQGDESFKTAKLKISKNGNICRFYLNKNLICAVRNAEKE